MTTRQQAMRNRERPLGPATWILVGVVLALGLGTGRCHRTPLLPTFVSATPSAGAAVPRSVWPVLTFATDVPEGALTRPVLRCDGVVRWRTAHKLDSTRVVLNPQGTLPAGATCDIQFATVDGDVTVTFATRTAGAAFQPVYDRRDRNQPLPFPDDYFMDPDASTATGLRLNLVAPDHDSLTMGLLNAMATVTSGEGDGFSPIGLMAVQLSAGPDTSSLPLDQEASLDPLSSVALVDLTPGAPTYGQRVPFKLTPRSDAIGSQPTQHSLIVFPGIPLAPLGRYALVVTNRAIGPGFEPLSRSAFFDAVAGDPQPGEAPEIAKARPLAGEVLDALGTLSPVPIPADDVALAVRLTVRDTSGLPDDLLAMRQQVHAAAPSFTIDTVTPGGGNVAAYVAGTFQAPDWRGSSFFLSRDGSGVPLPVGTVSIPFILALPNAAATTGHAPITMYQHGNPGSAQNEVPGAAQNFLAAGGFAVAGFTDVLNRDYPVIDDQQLAIFAVVLFSGDIPDFYVQTYGEQMAFVRTLKAMGGVDVLPVGAPDGIPDVDPTTLTYEGISYGSNHGQALMAYEPDIAAAGLVVGAFRLAESLEYQDRTMPTGGPPFLTEVLPGFLPGARPNDVWMGISLFSMVYDPQDPHNHAAFAYRNPVNVDGTTRKASILSLEGIGDSFTKNNMTRSLAWTLGLSQLTPAAVPVSYLTQQAGPIQANIGPQTTGAFVQFVPAGVPGLTPSPGCEFQFEGHYCPQSAPAARAMRRVFYQTAVTQSAPVVEFQSP